MVKWLAGSPSEWDSPYRWVRGLRRVGLIPLKKGIPLCDKRTSRGKFGLSAQVPAGETSGIGFAN